MSTLKLTLTRSTIGRTAGQIEAIKALGLKRIGDTVEVPATPAMLGQVDKVKFLLEIQK
jgi:large subunit ribosomal protein L30